MTFLPIAILAYTLNAGVIIIDKILLRKSIESPAFYTFLISSLQILVIFFAPFGFTFSLNPSTYLAVLSGIFFVLALYSMFTSLKKMEASIVGPIIGALNPLFALILGGIILQESLTNEEYLAFFVLILGAVILTANLWLAHLKFQKSFLWLVLAGLLFAISYVLLREVFLQTTFINGLIISRVGGAFFPLPFLLSKQLRKSLFNFHPKTSTFSKNSTLGLVASGQIMGALSSLLLFFTISLKSPALVNSLFGVQYLVILGAALILSKRNPNLLDENLSKSVIFQKIIGAGVLSWGMYLLSR